ncbi:serine/arginine repetitive matrix protein 2-like isoform X2 [Branchiostoma floridae]|uniref:Serine/arginine repetitive matrix protein 2-like isoform X2 n=1 Tax=Branchiostoma floridae TaxID=7739 RepID=A0A9J7N2M1_BRAFL|nr:serine/arginine repetitive matrix protein 2-like isoform X2 [Branchiostoma floridae]
MMESVSSTTGTELTRVQHILGLMQKNLECPICLDLLKNPVSTRCDHQFCRFCILKALTGKQSVSCPLCKVEVTKRSLQDNTQLQQIITAVQSVTEAVYKDTDQQKAPPVGSSQNYSKSQDQKEQGEKRRHISTDSEEGNGVPSTVQVRNRRNIRQAKKRKVEETPVYIEEDPIDDHSAPRTTTNINISHGFPVQELSKGRKNRNLNNPPNREAHRRSAPRRTRHAPRRDGRSSNREQGSGHLEPTVTSAELLSALVENSLGVSGDGHVTNGCHGDDDVTGNADPSAEDGRLLHVLGEASLGLFEQSGAKDIQESTTVLNSGGKVPTIEEHKEDQVGEKPLLTSHDHNDGSHADQEPHGDDQKSDTLGPTISEAEPLDISKDQEQMAVDLLTTEVEDEVPADIGKEVKAQEKVEFWLKHHNTTATEPGGTEDLDPYEFIGSQQDHAKGKKKSRKRGKKGRKPPAADNRNKKSPKSSSGPSKGKPTKTSAKKVEEVEDVEVDCEDLDQEEGEASAASMTDCSEASWKPGQSDPDWGKGRSSRRKSAETNADKESVSSKGRKRKQRNPADREDQMTVSSGSSSQLRIDRWVQRKEKLFVKSYSKPASSRREKTLLHKKKAAGLEEQWRRAKDMAGDFSAKVLHPIAEELPSKTKKKSKDNHTTSKASTKETCSATGLHPLQDLPSLGEREEVLNSEDDMCVYLTSNGELLNSPEKSDNPSDDDQDQEKQPTKEKSVALTEQEQKIAADLNELDEQTLSQLGMFSQQYLQKRKRRKDRKKRLEEVQNEDEDNIFAAIRALESESNLCNKEHQTQDETSRKEDNCTEVVDAGDVISAPVDEEVKKDNNSRKSRQARSLSRDRRGQGDVTEEKEARPRRTRSSSRKSAEDVLVDVGNAVSDRSSRQAGSSSKTKTNVRKNQNDKEDGETNGEEQSRPDCMKDECEHIPQDAGTSDKDKLAKKQKEETERQQTAKEEKTSEKELETRQEGSVNIEETAMKENATSPKALQMRKRHAAEKQTNKKALGNMGESLGVRQTRRNKKMPETVKEAEPPKHLPLVTTKDTVPQDPYQFQYSQESNRKKAGKKKGRRQRGKVKKLKRTKARKRELLLIQTGWIEREEAGEDEDSEEENGQENVEDQTVDELNVDESRDAQAHLDKQEERDQDTKVLGEEKDNTEVSVIPESNPNTEPISSSVKNKKHDVDLTACQPSCSLEETPGIYSTDIIPPSVEGTQIMSPQAGKKKRKTSLNKKKTEEDTSQRETGEDTKLSKSGKVSSPETENSEDIIQPSWQDLLKQTKDKISNKPENMKESERAQDENIRRSPRRCSKNASANRKGKDQDIKQPRMNSPEKDKDGPQDVLSSPRRRPKKPLEEQDIRRSPRHSTHKPLAGAVNAEQDAIVNSRHHPEQDEKQNTSRTTEHSPEKALDKEDKEMIRSPRRRTEKVMNEDKNKTGKGNLHPGNKEKRNILQDFGNVVRNIPDTITLASPSPPRRNFAGVASNTRSHKRGEGCILDSRNDEEILSLPASQDRSLENSMEDCGVILESETTTEFDGKLVEVVADVHRLAEFSEGSQQSQRQNKLRKASDIQSPGRHASGRTPASLRSSGRDSTPGEVPPTPPPPSTPPVLPATISTSGQKAAKDRNRLSIQRRSSQLSSPENTPSICSNSQENTPSTPGVQKSLPTSTKSQPKSSATPPDAVDNEKDTPKSCPPESEVSTVCSQVSTPEVDTDSDVVPDTEENPTKKGKRKSSNLQKASDSEATPRTKVTSPSMMFQQSFPDSGNTEASVSLLENVKPRGAETVSQQKRKSPRLSRGVSDSGKQERKCSDEPKETVTQKLEQSEAEQTNSKRHLKEQRGKEEVKTDNLKPTEKVVGKQASFEGLIQQSNEIEHYDVTDDDKEDLQMEDIEEEDGQEEEDAVEDEDDSEEDDLVPPTPPDTSFTQLTQRTKTVKSKTWTPERVTREDLKENNFQPVILEEEEDRECNWSDDDNDELPDLDEEPEHQVSSTGHSNTATPQNGGRNKAEEQPDAKEGFKENQKDTDINTRSQSKRRKAASGEIEAKDEATDESMPKRRKSDIDSEWKEERIPKVDVVNVTAGFENNEESDLSQDSHVHDLTNASSLSELYDTQNQDKLKNDVQNLEGQMAMIQMLLAKGKERARETGKEENTNKDPTSIAKQHLTTVYEENMQMSEGDHEEILSGKDLYGTPSSQASAKCTYSTAQEETPRKRRPSSTSTPQSNHSPTKEYNFRKRMLSPQRSQEASAKSRKSRQSSPRSSQPCLSPRSPSPPPPLSPEKTRTPRVLPPAVQAAANILEKFRSPDLATKGKRRNSGNSSPLGKEDSTARRLSPRTKKESQSPPDRKNTTPRSSSFKTSASKSPSSPRSKKYDIEKRMNLEDEVEDSMPVENLVSTAARNRRSLNKRKRKSLQDTFADEEDETMRCDDAPSPGDHKIPTSEEPEEMSTNWKAFQQMKCDILAQKGTSTSNGQNKEAPKRLSLPSTMKSDRCTSDKRKSEPVVSSSQFDRNSITNNPSTPQPRKNPLTFSQQPSPSVGNLSQTVSRRKKESPRLIGSSKSPIDRLPHGNTEKLTSTSSCSAVKSVAGPPTVVKTEWQNDNRAPMTFVTTGLSREETRAVHELAKKTGSQVKQSFDNSTTHVITRTDVDLFCSRTLKFFLGIAGRKWIVSFQWIAACLEEGKHVPEDPYEVRGDLVHGCHGGPRQARSNKGKLLLCDYEICIYGKFTALTRDDLQFMVELCGGTVVKEPHMFPHDKKPLIVSQIDANQLTEEDYNVFYRRYGVLSVTRDWILDSVSSYQIQPIERYLMCSTKNQNIIVID